MNLFLAVLLLCCILLYFIWLYKIRDCGSPKFPPGPTGFPIFGNIFLIKKLSKKYEGLHGAFEQLAKEYKTSILGLHLGSTPVVGLFSRKYLKILFSEENLQGRPDDFFTRLRTMGERRGIKILDGPAFHEQRSFAVRHLNQLGFQTASMKNITQLELKYLLEYIKPRAANAICINKLLKSAVLNVLWTFVAGRRFLFDDPFLLKLFDAFDERGKLFDLAGGILAPFPWLRFLAPEKSGYKLILDINEKLKHFIDTQLVAVCLDLFIAGLHTTSDTLTFALITMVKFPEIQTKVQACLDEVLGKNETANYDHKPLLPYIEAVLLESMRYMHVAPLYGPRRVMNDMIIDGYLLPKSTTVIGNLNDYYNCADIWGDPEIFRPERFLNQNGEVFGEERHFFFGRGARSCIGAALAKQFIFTCFSGILHNYEISLAPSAEMPAAILGMTTTPQPFWISMHPRAH